jgi:hypothetical protein
MAEEGKVMSDYKNPCMAAAVSAGKWYQRLNGKTRILIQFSTIVMAIVIGTLGFEARYAKSADVEPIKSNVQSLVAAMTIQQVTRQTVLELKMAEGTITPEEEVELKGITKVLEALK